MYHALIDGRDISAERLQWVKPQPNGVNVICPESEGRGVILDGKTYHVEGRPAMDAPTVAIFWQDDVKALSDENERLKDTVDALILSALEG